MTKNEFYKQWLEHFALGIPPKDLKKYVVSTGNLIWHSPTKKIPGDMQFHHKFKSIIQSL